MDAKRLKSCKEFTKIVKENLTKSIAEKVEIFGKPQLAIITVGENEASKRYVRNKIKDCEEVGIAAHNYHFDEKINTKELIEEINDLEDHYDGIIVQLPLPRHISQSKIQETMNPAKDVDGFHPMSQFEPATPAGIMAYLSWCDIDLDGKNVLIIGRSDIVGKPLAQMMTAANATVTLAHSHTKSLSPHIERADLIVSAVGKAKFLNCYPIYVPVIDVGINFDEDGKMVGDCYNTENRDVSPVPGGVGLLTRCALLVNVYNAWIDNHRDNFTKKFENALASLEDEGLIYSEDS